MTEAQTNLTVTREAVASFATKEALRDAVGKLIAAGFAPASLSILATHQSLEVAGELPGYPGTPGESLIAGLTDEARFIVPLVIAGVAMVSGGPIAITLGALVAAGLGGAAIKEVIDRVSANQHSGEYATALQRGAVLLWVEVADAALEATATRLLEEAGGVGVHMYARAAGG
jgi:hypothetical protein